MKRKELKNIAQKLAKLEKLLQDQTITIEEKKRAQEDELKLCSQVKSLEDMAQVDEMVQEILKNI